MNTLIIFDHPYTAEAHRNEPHNRSFCAAVCKALIESEIAKGNSVDLIDLHVDGFDPVMSAEDLKNWRQGIPMNRQVADYQRRIAEAERIAFIFPIWWELMPAMTKGFIDKVYAKGILYDQPDKGPMRTKLDRKKQIAVFTVMGSPKFIYNTIFGKPVIKALQRGTFMKTGLKHFIWKSYSQVDELDLKERQNLLDTVSF